MSTNRQNLAETLSQFTHLCRALPTTLQKQLAEHYQRLQSDFCKYKDNHQVIAMKKGTVPAKKTFFIFLYFFFNFFITTIQNLRECTTNKT